MSFRVIWFVVAGFVLGFTTSTLWEWLYYRQKRLQMLDQHRQTLLDAGRNSAVSNPPNFNPSTNTEAEWQLPTYRSSGVFLESEETTLPAPATPSNQQRQSADAESSAPATSTEEVSIKTESPTASTSSVESQVDARESKRDGERNGQAATRADASVVAHSTAPTGADHVAVTKATIAQPPSASKATSASAISSSGTPASIPSAGSDGSSPAAVDHPDNLADIKGIGEAYKRRLYATGVYTWRQLAENDTDTLRRITRAKPNADIRSWQAQAQELAQKHNRWQADFNGPLDDFTRIEGIGAITADILYKVGICTYERLAATSIDELTRIVPAPTVGDENDFEGWLREASQLATAKEHNGGRLP